MRILTRIVLTTMVSLLGTTAQVSADDRIQAGGDFTAGVDFTTLTLTPVGANCLLEVEGVLEFTGTLEGSARGRTRVLVLASCPEVAANPPGVFKDVFRSTLEFVGTVHSTPAIVDLTYQGITEVGGDIKALMLLSGPSGDSNSLKGLLKVEAVVAVGGSYEGFIRLREAD